MALGAKIDLSRCRASVHGPPRSISFHQCQAKAKHFDGEGVGWCGTHSPEAVERREAARRQRYKQKSKEHEVAWQISHVGRAYVGTLERTGDYAKAAEAARLAFHDK